MSSFTRRKFLSSGAAVAGLTAAATTLPRTPAHADVISPSGFDAARGPRPKRPWPVQDDAAHGSGLRPLRGPVSIW